jgi:tRNA (Thr-GGU) A37 N-methylase
MPIQPASARGITGTVEMEPEYADGLKDIEGFSEKQTRCMKQNQMKGLTDLDNVAET